MRRFVLLPALAILLSTLVRAAEPPDTGLSPEVTAAELREHVKMLASDGFGGRRSGTEGGEKAAAFIAARFEEVGLTPAGDDGTFQQSFELPGRTLRPAESRLRLTPADGEPEDFAPGDSWRNFPSAADGEITGAEVAFAGHGIRAPDLGWDDYQDVDVTGKVVVILRHGPREGRPGYRYAERNLRYVTFDRKVRNAMEAGAVAALLVNDRAHHADHPDVLAPAGLGRGVTIPYLFVREEVGRAILAAGGIDFDGIQAEIDETAAPRSRALPGVRLDLTVATSPARTTNVVGLLPGSDPALAAEVVVIGGHYDHLGTDGMGALDPDAAGEIRNGADDNASGTSGVIELAEHFALSRPRPKRSIVFVAFAGEELGLLGSAYYVEHPAIPIARTVAMLNMDMIGRSDGDFLYVGGTGTSPVFDAILDRASAGAELTIQRGEGGVAPSDNTSFFRKGVPALFFFTGMHPDYHRATDDWEKLNYETQARVVAFVARTARAIADLPERPAYVANTGGFRPGAGGAYLGVVPERGGDGFGVELAQVAPGSPAEKAGLLAGDVIVKIGDADTPDLGALVATLTKRKPDENVQLHVLRGGEELVVPVTLGRR